MRYIVMHKSDPVMEAGGPPDARIVQDMGALVGGSIKEGVFLDGAGLHRSAQRVRLRFTAGEASITRGPYAGDNELIDSMTMIKVRDLDAAISVAQRYAEVLGEGEIEIGPVVQPWDIGVMPKPEKIESMQFLLLLKGERGSDQRKGRSKTRKLDSELEKSGVLLKTHSLAPLGQGARLATGGKRAWVDGPFAESKELVAGFSILELPGLPEVKAWADRYAAILGPANEVDIRPLAED